MKLQSSLRSLRKIASMIRITGVLGAVGILLSGTPAAHAQFRPIPNYVGIGAGAQFRNDINNHLSGAASVAPRIVSLPLGQLPTEQDGQEYWCSDCKQTNPCVGSGLGALALGSQGQWSCTSGATLPNGFPLSIDASAAAHRIQGLAPNTITGDALSQGQSHLNDLTTATANYNMGANRLQNLSAGAVAGDAISYGQSGAKLNGLNLNSNKLAGLTPGSTSGDAVAYAQTGAQFTVGATPAGTITASVNFSLGGHTTSVSPPAGIVNGNVLLAEMTGGAGNSVTYPPGFVQIRQDSDGTAQLSIACKIAASESGSYAFDAGAGGFGQVSAAIINIPGANSCMPDASNSTNSGSANLLSLAPFALASNNDAVITMAEAGNGAAGIAPLSGTALWNIGSSYFQAAGYLTATGNATPSLSAQISGAAAHMVFTALAFRSAGTSIGGALVGNQQGATVTSIIGSVNNVLNVMAPPYGAQGDGNSDDLGAIQQAVYDACGATPPASFPTATRKTVYLPRAPVCYMHSKPIRLPCTNLEFKGDTGTSLCQNYYGNAVIQNGWGTSNLPYASALVGSGNSLVSAAGILNKSIDLGRFLNGTGTNNLNTRFATGFNIAFFMKATAAGGQILGSAAAYPGTGNGAFLFNYNGTNQVIASVNLITSGLHTFATCPAQTLGNVYEDEIDWDGATYRVWQGTPAGTAVLCDSFASTNRITQGVFEEVMLPDGGPHEFWPDGSSNQSNAFAGDIDSVRFEDASVHTTAYTVPSAKFANDGNTNLLVNFDTSLDSTQLAYTGIGGPHNVYLPVFDLTGNIGSTGFENVHDMELCGSANGTVTPDGLFAGYGNGSRWTNLSCSSAYYSQADFFGNDYLAHVENWNGFGGHVGLNFGGAWNDSINSNAQIDGTDVACEVYHGGGGGDHEDYHSRCVDRGSLRYGWIENQSQANYYYPFVDQEFANSNFIATFLLNSPAQPYVFVSGNIDTRNSAPYIQQDNGGYGSTVLGMAFGTFGASTSAAEILNYTNGTPLSPTQLIDTWNPVGVALSNQAGNPNILTLGNGSSSMMQSLELQQAPKFDAGLNHLIVNAIADPAAATIAVVGGTASAAYGPYFVVCHDANGGVTLPSASSNTVANGPPTLSSSNYVNITWSAVSGCASFDILKGSTGTALAIGVTGTSYHDVGGSTSAYTAPIRNTTGDLSGLAQISTGTTFAKLPGTVVNGMRVYCTNCDPPANPPIACTSSGARTGAFADGVNNNWLCVP